MFDRELEVLFSKYPKIDSVISYGSYGRGEATVINAGKSIKLYNDIDLIIVSPDKVEIQSLLDEIKEEVRAIVGTHWVDVLVWNQRDLIKKRNTIFYYDFVNGHRTIYGKAPILNPISSEDITNSDIYNMYQTRMWALSYTLFTEVNAKDERLLYYQLSKVVIAIVDFLLLSEGVYKTKLHEKEKEINSLSCIDIELRALFLSSVQFKKTLDVSFFKNIDLEDYDFKNNLLRLYNDAHRKVYSSEMQRFITTLYSECRLFVSMTAVSIRSSSILPFKKYFARLWLSFRTNQFPLSYISCKSRARISSVLSLLSE